ATSVRLSRPLEARLTAAASLRDFNLSYQLPVDVRSDGRWRTGVVAPAGVPVKIDAVVRLRPGVDTRHVETRVRLAPVRAWGMDWGAVQEITLQPTNWVVTGELGSQNVTYAVEVELAPGQYEFIVETRDRREREWLVQEGISWGQNNRLTIGAPSDPAGLLPFWRPVIQQLRFLGWSDRRIGAGLGFLEEVLLMGGVSLIAGAMGGLFGLGATAGFLSASAAAAVLFPLGHVGRIFYYDYSGRLKTRQTSARELVRLLTVGGLLRAIHAGLFFALPWVLTLLAGAPLAGPPSGVVIWAAQILPFLVVPALHARYDFRPPAGWPLAVFDPLAPVKKLVPVLRAIRFIPTTGAPVDGGAYNANPQRTRILDKAFARLVKADPAALAQVNMTALRAIAELVLENTEQHGTPGAEASLGLRIQDGLIRLEIFNESAEALPTALNGEFSVERPNGAVPEAERGVGTRWGQGVSKIPTLAGVLYRDAESDLSSKIRWSWRRDPSDGKIAFVFTAPVPAARPQRPSPTEFATEWQMSGPAWRQAKTAARSVVLVLFLSLAGWGLPVESPRAQPPIAAPAASADHYIDAEAYQAFLLQRPATPAIPREYARAILLGLLQDLIPNLLDKSTPESSTPSIEESLYFYSNARQAIEAILDSPALLKNIQAPEIVDALKALRADLYDEFVNKEVGAPDIVYWKKRFAAVRGLLELSAPLVREFLRRQPAVPSTAGTRLGSLSPLRSERETLLAMVGVLAAAPRPRRRSLWEKAGAIDEDRPAEWLGWEVRSIQLPDGQTLRVALRPGNPAVPGVVYIYGGGEAAFNPALDFGEATVVIIERRTEVKAQELILKAAADIRLVLPRLESQNIHFPQGFFLVGHSLGGHIAAELATASPTAFARKIRGIATINWAVPQPAFIGQMNAVIGWMNQSVRVFSLFTFWPFVPAQWAKFRETAIKNLDRLIVPLTAHAYQIVTGRTLVFDKHFAPLSQAAAESEALQHYLRDRFSQTWATFERENTLPILLIRNTNDPLTYGLAARVRDLHVSDEFSDQRPVRWAVNLMTGDHPAEWHSPHMDASQVALVADALKQFMKHATAPAGENVLDFPPAVARAPRVEFRQWGLLGSLGFAVGLATLSMVYLAGVTVGQASPALAALGTAGTALLGSGLWSALVRVRRLNRWGGVLGGEPTAVSVGGAAAADFVGETYLNMGDEKPLFALVSPLNDSGLSFEMQTAVRDDWAARRGFFARVLAVLPRSWQVALGWVSVSTVTFMGYMGRALESGLRDPWKTKMLEVEIDPTLPVSEWRSAALTPKVRAKMRAAGASEAAIDDFSNWVGATLAVWEGRPERNVLRQTQTVRNLLIAGVLFRAGAYPRPGVLRLAAFHNGLADLALGLGSRVIPVPVTVDTAADFTLTALDGEGRALMGEKEIGYATRGGVRRFGLRRAKGLSARPVADPLALDILRRDAPIFLGPGSPQSLWGCLVTAGVPEALAAAKAGGRRVTWVFNATQNTTTAGRSPEQFAETLERSLASLLNAPVSVGDYFTHVLVNRAVLDPSLVDHLRREEDDTRRFARDPRQLHNVGRTDRGFWTQATAEETQQFFESRGVRPYVMPLAELSSEGYRYVAPFIEGILALQKLGFRPQIYDLDDTLTDANRPLEPAMAQALWRLLRAGGLFAVHSKSNFDEVKERVADVLRVMANPHERYLLRMLLSASLADIRRVEADGRVDALRGYDFMEVVTQAAVQERSPSAVKTLLIDRVGPLMEGLSETDQAAVRAVALGADAGRHLGEQPIKALVGLWLETVIARVAASPRAAGAVLERRPLDRDDKVMYALRKIPNDANGRHRRRWAAWMNAQAAAAGLAFRFEVGGKTSIDISDAFLTKARALEIFARYFGYDLSDLIYGGDKLEIGEPDRPAAERAAAYLAAAGRLPETPIPGRLGIVPRRAGWEGMAEMIDLFARVLEAENPPIVFQSDRFPSSWSDDMRRLATFGGTGFLDMVSGGRRALIEAMDLTTDQADDLVRRHHAIRTALQHPAALDEITGYANRLMDAEGVRHVVWAGVGATGPYGRLLARWPSGRRAAGVFGVDQAAPEAVADLESRLIAAEASLRERFLLRVGARGVAARVLARAYRHAAVVIVTKGGESDLHALTQYFDAALRGAGAPAGHLLILTDNDGAELKAEAVGRNWETKPISLQPGESVQQRHFYSTTWVSLLPLAFKRYALKDLLARVAPYTRARGEGLDGFVKLGAWLRGWSTEGKNRVALLLPAALEGVGPLVSRLVEPSLLHGDQSILVSYYDGRAPPVPVTGAEDIVYVRLAIQGQDDPSTSRARFLETQGQPVATIVLPEGRSGDPLSGRGTEAFLALMDGLEKTINAISLLRGDNPVAPIALPEFDRLRAMYAAEKSGAERSEPLARFGRVALRGEALRDAGLESFVAEARRRAADDSAPALYAALLDVLMNDRVLDLDVQEVRYYGYPNPRLKAALVELQSRLWGAFGRLVKYGDGAHLGLVSGLKRAVDTRGLSTLVMAVRHPAHTSAFGPLSGEGVQSAQEAAYRLLRDRKKAVLLLEVDEMTPAAQADLEKFLSEAARHLPRPAMPRARTGLRGFWPRALAVLLVGGAITFLAPAVGLVSTAWAAEGNAVSVAGVFVQPVFLAAVTGALLLAVLRSRVFPQFAAPDPDRWENLLMMATPRDDKRRGGRSGGPSAGQKSDP
nr:hypothetical protein [Elusimicrobiota bacterium]